MEQQELTDEDYFVGELELPDLDEIWNEDFSEEMREMEAEAEEKEKGKKIKIWRN